MKLACRELQISNKKRKFYYDIKDKYFIKVINTSDIQSLHEATGLLAKNQPNYILTPHAISYHGDEIKIVFPRTSVDLHRYTSTHVIGKVDMGLIILDVLYGVKELHDANLIHCDLKLENLVVCNRTKRILIIDLDYTTYNKPINKILDAKAYGTTGLIAPEMEKREWNNSIDFYAVGRIIKDICYGHKELTATYQKLYESLTLEDPKERLSFVNGEHIIDGIVKEVKEILGNNTRLEYSDKFIKSIFNISEKTKRSVHSIRIL